jgi:integrase
VTSNTCDRVTRSRGSPCPARGYSTEEVGRILDVDPDTIEGRRDRGILLVFVLTGRRRSEVMDLKASDITIEDGTVYSSDRGKGGKRERRELSRWALGGHPADAEGLRQGTGPDGPCKSVRSSPPR